MGKTETRKETALNRARDRDDQDRDDEPNGPAAATPAPAAAHAEPSVSPLKLHKPGQGAVVRWSTGAAAGVISLAFAGFVFEQLGRYTFAQSLAVRYTVPAVLLVALGAWVFHLVGRHRAIVDFLIATEGEMKKVNWSSRKDVFGATRVVIFTVMALGLILFIVDYLFIQFFEAIGVLRIQVETGAGGG